MILGLDADTFTLKGGESFFEQAQVILNYSQQENYRGWNLADGRQTRYTLITNLMVPTYKEFRSVMFDYHFNGLDKMHDNQRVAKANIAEALLQFNDLNARRPNSFLVRIFFDAKADEWRAKLGGASEE